MKLNREQVKALLEERIVIINLPPGCDRLEVSAPLADTAERILRETDAKAAERKHAFIDAVLKGL